MDDVNRPDVPCREIDDDVIELHVRGKMTDSPVRQHLETCESCKVRVAEYRAYIQILKQALRE
jgi:anti-sigma factor RsiW